MPPRQGLIFSLLALIVSFIITRGLVEQPGYTDAFYYFNAANRFVSGEGLTDAYLWVYIGQPESLPAPSHLYWMPFTSLAASFGMWLLGSPGDYHAAQIPFTIMFAGTAIVGFWLGGKIGRTSRHQWVTGLLTLFSGFFTRFWGMTDTFAPYAFVGSLALLWMALGTQSDNTSRRRLIVWFIAGVFAGLGHLTRADGLLLLLLGWFILFLAATRSNCRLSVAVSLALLFTSGYLIVMTPWLIRNLNEVGTLLPTGGIQAVWYTDYNDLFRYPPGVTMDEFFSNGLRTFIASRWKALTNNLGTLLAVEGMVVITPLMLIGLWIRRKERFFQPFISYALALHVSMTFIFPFPGYRGGLFHSAAALIPWWMALGVVGLDDVIEWVAKRRRQWKPVTAKRVFSMGLIWLGLSLSWSIGAVHRTPARTPRVDTELLQILPVDARIMINDPAQLYYFTEMGGVVLPNASIEVLPEIAARYQITYLLIEFVDGFVAAPQKLSFDLDSPPPFLTPMPLEVPNMRLYAIQDI